MRQETVGGNHFMFLEASEILGAARGNQKWMQFQREIHGGMPTTAQFEHDVVLGNEDYVARSEAFLASVEDQIPLSRGYRVLDDVVGAILNVPAFLAGHPQHMRRRVRMDKETAPITIFMDLGSSMSITSERILRRGIVLLALVRMLANHRPVDLWVGSCLGDSYQTGTCAWRIDTVPLDLARAAFHIADASMSRMFAYAMCEKMVDKHLGDRPGNYVKHMLLLKEVAGWNDILLLPAILASDPMTDDPVGWLRHVMGQYVRSDE